MDSIVPTVMSIGIRPDLGEREREKEGTGTGERMEWKRWNGME
jgi:hypothetical protein